MSPGLVAEELSSKLMSGFLKTNCDTLRVVVIQGTFPMQGSNRGLLRLLH